MSLFGEIAAFGAGVVMMIAMLSALYGIVDLWYMIASAWPRVLRGILAWGAAIGVLAWLLGPPERTAFATGLVAYLVFYLSLFPLFRIFLWAIRRKS